VTITVLGQLLSIRFVGLSPSSISIEWHDVSSCSKPWNSPSDVTSCLGICSLYLWAEDIELMPLFCSAMQVNTTSHLTQGVELGIEIIKCGATRQGGSPLLTGRQSRSIATCTGLCGGMRVYLSGRWSCSMTTSARSHGVTGARSMTTGTSPHGDMRAHHVQEAISRRGGGGSTSVSMGSHSDLGARQEPEGLSQARSHVAVCV
jgi:hypothetical protein